MKYYNINVRHTVLTDPDSKGNQTAKTIELEFEVEASDMQQCLDKARAYEFAFSLKNAEIYKIEEVK